MPRERRKDPWITCRDGWFYVSTYDPKRRKTIRHSLKTKSAAEAMRSFALHKNGTYAPLSPPVDGLARKKAVAKWINRARTNAAERGRKYTLTPALIDTLLERQEFKCALSGIPFDFSGKSGPWQPSIDRIDSTGDYTPSNVRLVCLIANIAMNRWGSAALNTLAHAITHRNIDLYLLD